MVLIPQDEFERTCLIKIEKSNTKSDNLEQFNPIAYNLKKLDYSK